jgi:hypothetical protein
VGEVGIGSPVAPSSLSVFLRKIGQRRKLVMAMQGEEKMKLYNNLNETTIQTKNQSLSFLYDGDICIRSFFALTPLVQWAR